MKKRISFITLLSLFTVYSHAQDDSIQVKKWYFSRSTDAAVASFSNVTRNGATLNSVPRFVFFINGGTNFNYNFSKRFGVHTGWNVKNNGIVYDDNDSVRYKRRVIMIGTPVAVRIGNLIKGNYFYAGAQAEFAVNYKEKKFINGKRVEKFNDWFSKRTPDVTPCFFAGFYTAKGVGMRACYFPQNFFNQSYDENGIKPFDKMEARNVFFVTVSYNFSIIQRILKKYMTTAL